MQKIKRFERRCHHTDLCKMRVCVPAIFRSFNYHYHATTTTTVHFNEKIIRWQREGGRGRDAIDDFRRNHKNEQNARRAFFAKSFAILCAHFSDLDFERESVHLRQRKILWTSNHCRVRILCRWLVVHENGKTILSSFHWRKW